MKFQWSRSETIGLAAARCAHCLGYGLRRNTCRKGPNEPCNCVLRSVFRACYNRFRFCAGREKTISQARIEIIGGKDRRQVWGRKNEEFIADFCLVSERFLDEAEYRIFKFHYLLGADWKLCCRQLKMDRGNFFHSLYRIQQKLGRIFRELEPYPLYPVDEYFGGTMRKSLKTESGKVLQMPVREGRRALRPPLRKVA